jgi:hypothetical protein
MNATIARSIIREHIQDNIRATLDLNINREASDAIKDNVRFDVSYCVEENLWCTGVLDNVWLIVYDNVSMSIKTHIPNAPLSNK